VLTLARPQSGETAVAIKSSGVDIILAIDTSGSMQALDFQQDGQRVDRLTAVKKVVKEFIKGRGHDRLGMVVFGEEAFTQCPLTLDYGILLSFLDRLSIGMAGDATAIGSAIAISTKRLKDLKAQSKIVILLTDGRNNAGRISPEVATDAAAALGIRIYTIGAGTHGKAPFKIDTLFGPKYVYREVDIDEESLQKIAQKTGGQYFRATDSDSLAQIYKHIDALEKSEVELKEYSEYHEHFLWFLLPALLGLLGNIVLSQTVLKRFP
jgi:Ca-activated chloride channel family protein